MPHDLLFGQFESRKRLWKDVLLLLAGFGVLWGTHRFGRKDG